MKITRDYFISVKRGPNYLWAAADGSKIGLHEMTNKHLYNAYKCLKGEGKVDLRGKKLVGLHSIRWLELISQEMRYRHWKMGVTWN